jgi:hypothetical protein
MSRRGTIGFGSTGVLSATISPVCRKRSVWEIGQKTVPERRKVLKVARQALIMIAVLSSAKIG